MEKSELDALVIKTRIVAKRSSKETDRKLAEFIARGDKGVDLRVTGTNNEERMQSLMEIINSQKEIHSRMGLWIKCSDRLPDDKLEVLCAYKYGGYAVLFKSGRFWDDGDFNSAIDLGDVTYWKLIEPPHDDD